MLYFPCRILLAAILLMLALPVIQSAEATKADAKAEAKAAKAKDAAKAKAREDANANRKPSPALPVDLPALRRGIEHLIATAAAQYPNGARHKAALEALEKDAATDRGVLKSPAFIVRCEDLKYAALVVDNPLVTFDQVLVIRREAGKLGLPQNWQGNSSMPQATSMRNEIMTLKIKVRSEELRPVFKPAKTHFVGDLDLHFDGDRFLFSSIGENKRWQLFEVKVDGSGLRQVSPSTPADVDNYDGMYLPDGRIIFDCTSTFVGVPCVGGSAYVGNIHIMNADGSKIRRLCFDQDNNWDPVLMPDGKVLYQRWEYTDSAHYFSRILLRMNPDGTGQSEFYGSNSYWPNSMFYQKPIPGSTTKFVAVVGGHHGVVRMGELHLFDASKGRREASGVVQQIPGWGKTVVAKTLDKLVEDSWPKFLHPMPLDDTFIVVAAKPTKDANWGIYLVDVFDNMVLIKEEPGWALLEPVPLRKTVKPPIMPDRVDLTKKTASVFIQDIYEGPGLKGVPRGAVKALRIFQYEYAYRNMGGHYVIGMEGPWDVRRIIGTVPVMEDGSASFEIPANVPISIQPLDVEGKAMQLIRSWFTAMPGEHLSCVGCHEVQNSTTPVKRTQAAPGKPAVPTPWYGPKRGFAFSREVQPVLDRYCAGCHDGQKAKPNLADVKVMTTSMGNFPASYVELHPYVRRNGPEGVYHILTPLEFHTDTSELVQMLTKGHHNVKLDPESWDRLVTWIDLNVPAYGTWSETRQIPSDFAKRRYEMRKEYAGVDEDIEAIPEAPKPVAFQPPAPLPPRPAAVTVPGWPMAADQAQAAQKALGQTDLNLDLGDAGAMELKRIPAGTFAMGDVNGEMDEFPMATVTIAKPFWMGATEISLRQYRAFKAEHNNGYYDMHYKDQVKPGYHMDTPEFPVIRVSWDDAMAFCAWLSKKTGRKVTLPTEAQWEWACRAGSATPFWYGDRDADFSKNANVADRQISQLAVKGVNPKPIPKPDRFWDYVPKDARFDDGTLHLAPVTQYEANPWGLKNMHGNVCEWTADTYRPYPYQAAASSAGGKKTVRGGSWERRPTSARASFRLPYPSWQRVYDVGFRVIVED